MKCRQGSEAVNRYDLDLKLGCEKRTISGDGADTDAKFSRAVSTDSPTHRVEPVSSEQASEKMWEDVSDVSETSGISCSCSDLTAIPATTRVTVVGNGLIQVSPADPLTRKLSLASDKSSMSVGQCWKTGDDPKEHSYLWNTFGEEHQEWEQSMEDDLNVSMSDVDGHPRHLVQLQNILPLFIFGTNKEGSRSVQLALIGDHEMKSEYLVSRGRAHCGTASDVDNSPRNSHLLPKSTIGQVSELVNGKLVIAQ